MASEDPKPVKGILKNSTSFEKADSSERKRDMKWDEMNILATYHPEGKEYGHMKIDEPPTPYAEMTEGDEEEANEGIVDADELREKLQSTSKQPSAPTAVVVEAESSSEEEDEPLTEKQQDNKRAFELKRKLHYNEFQAVKLGRQLLDEEDDEDEEASNKGAGEKTNQTDSHQQSNESPPS